MPKPLDPFLFRAIDLAARLRHPELARRYRIRRSEDGRPGPFRVAVPTCSAEKYAWRMLFDRDPRFSTLNDKLACKDWVRDQGIDVPMAKVLWVGTDAHDIPAELFARPIVIKANLGCGLNLFHDGKPEQRAEILAKTAPLLAKASRSPGLWDYFDIDPKLFVEERVFGGQDFCDLKVTTCGGKIAHMRTIYGPVEAQSDAFWDPDGKGGFTRININLRGDIGPDRRPLPRMADQAIEIAARIGGQFDHLRVDFFCNDTTLYLGELTFNTGNGLVTRGFDPTTQINRLWDLRQSRFMTTQQSGWRRVYQAALRRRLDADAIG